MLENFSTHFAVTSGTPGAPAAGTGDVSGLFARYGGCTFNGGLYRVHSEETSKRAAVMLAEAYPEFRFPFVPFGFD